MDATLTTFLITAYSVMGTVAVVGYVPQMLAFWRNPGLCVSTPMTTWAIWAVQTVVFFFYALVVNGDRAFIGYAAASMTVTLACLGFQLWGRYRAKEALKGPRVVPFTPRPTNRHVA